MSTASRLITEEEGSSAHVYYCDGLAHVAVGCLVDPKVPCDGLCQEAIDAQLFHDVEKAAALAGALPGFQHCSDVRQAVLTSMTFQLGSLKPWLKLRDALARGDYQGAADEMLASHWAMQTPSRCRRQAEMMRMNLWLEKGADYGE